MKGITKAQWVNLSEQRICIVDANYILYEKNWTHTHSGTGSYGRQAGGIQAGRWHTGRWQAGVRRNTGEFRNFLRSLYIEKFDFYFV